MVSRNSSLKLCSKLLPVFKQFKATKSSGDKEHWTWSASKPLLSMRSVPFLLLTHLSQTVLWDTHFPLYWFPCVPPGGKVGWWKGVGDVGSGACGSPHRSRRAPLSAPMLTAARVLGCTHKHQGVFCGSSDTSLGCQPLPSVSLAVESSPHTPPSDRSSLWFSRHHFTPFSYCCLHLPGSWCVHFIPGPSLLS